jgi:hypothetical protein
MIKTILLIMLSFIEWLFLMRFSFYKLILTKCWNKINEAENANCLILKRLLNDHFHRTYEYFEKDNRFKQCFNCQRYNIWARSVKTSKLRILHACSSFVDVTHLQTIKSVIIMTTNSWLGRFNALREWKRKRDWLTFKKRICLTSKRLSQIKYQQFS